MTTTTEQTTRVPLRRPQGPLGRLFAWAVRRAFGQELDTALVLLHHKPMLIAGLLYEAQVSRFHALDPQLKTLAVARTAGQVGCSWCLDFGYYLAQSEGVDLVKLQQVHVWRDSTVFTGTERRVLELAEAATATPPEVSDAMIADLREEIGVEAVLELVFMIALENTRARFNMALGLTSQGLSDRCELPPPAGWTSGG